MAFRLFEHNARVYKAALAEMERYGKAAIIHPTGTGKSYIAFKLIADHPDTVVLWISPSEYIFKTQIEGLKKNDPDFSLENVHFFTYAKLMCCTEAQLAEIAGLEPSYIILDEFHRAGAECWGESTVALLKLCPNAKLLGLTATNIRYLDNNRDMAEELFDGHIASEITLGEAIVRGILPAPKYVTTVYQYQKILANYQTRVDNLRIPGIQDVNQKYLEALRRALEQADGLDLVFQHHITQTSGKYIVFCANKEHMDEMISHVPEWFAKVNPVVAVYEAYSDDPNTDKAFADFKADESNKLKLLFCIDMLNEGVHVEGISGVILFRPTISPIVYKQQIGRALTAGDNATPLILDIVNNFEGLCSISGLQDEMQEAVHRLYANGEGDKIITERFEIIEQVHDCRMLFERLQASLSSSWEQYFSEASIYYAEHGNLNIPKRYKTPAGLNLGEWLTTQRKVRAGQKAGNLSEQQIDRLDGIGMDWENRNDSAWRRGLEEAQKFREQFGNLQVPAKYKTKDGYAIYGYCKDERNKNRLVVDEYAADIVRSIYRRKLEGMSAQAIAEQLNSENVLAPSEYKRLCGLNYHSGFKAGTHAKWQAIQVLRILKNEVYTGTMVQGRRQKINYKIKKIRDVEESGWIRVPNMHEAIIPQKLFDTVQEVLKLDTCASKGQQTVNLFSGIVRCGGCGQNMVRRTVSKNGKKYIYLHCVTNHNGLGCSSHLISESKLEEVVLAALQGKIQQISGLEHRLDEINEIPKNERRLKSVEEHLKMLEQEEQKYQTLRRQLYEDMSSGIVSKEEYKEFSHSFNEKVEAIRKAKAEMNRQRDCLNNLDVEHLPWIEDFKSYQNLTSLNRRVLVELVESITVYHVWQRWQGERLGRSFRW